MSEVQLERIESQIHEIAKAVGRIEGKIGTELPRLDEYTRNNSKRVGQLEMTRAYALGVMAAVATAVSTGVSLLVAWWK